MPLFSVVMPCFNAAGTLPETLRSLQAQTCSDWEAICIDDGSTDETLPLLHRFAAGDDRIRIVRNPGKGPSAARNHGALELADGALVAFLDADDVWAADKLDATARALADPGLHASFARVAFFRTSPDRPTAYSSVRDALMEIDHLMGENPVCTMSNLTVRRTVFAATGGFDETMVHNEDLEWLIRLTGEGYRLAALGEVLVSYRASPTGLSADLDRMDAGRQAALRTAARYGVQPKAHHEAIHLRYLARRALRLQSGRTLPLQLALKGIQTSPQGFFSNRRRGALVAFAAIVAPLLPPKVSLAMFAR
ncbi:MAG: glycosyltransferase family A protein [Pseudomonadota bacterium]